MSSESFDTLEEDQQETFVREIIRHSPVSKTLENDISLLILEKPFATSSNVNTICLPGTFINNGSEICEVVGWDSGNRGMCLESK